MRSITSAGLGLWLAAQAHAQTIHHVDASATGLANGSTWTNAHTDLQTAIAGATAGDEIWVADGMYRPDQGTGQTPGPRTSTFYDRGTGL
jgi:hypothetical protein